MQLALQPLLRAPIRFFDWWLSELTALIPVRVAHLARSFAAVQRQEQGWEAVVVRRGRTVYRGPIPNAPLQGLSIHLRPDGSDVLSRKVTVPSKVVPLFGNVLRAEADRWTPYDYDELYMTFATAHEAGTSSTVEIRFIPRMHVATWLADLRDLGLSPSRLALGPERGQSIPLQEGRASRITLKTWALPIAAALSWVVATAVDATIAGSERNRWQDLLAAEVRELSVQRKLQEDIARTVSMIKQGEAARANPRGALLAAIAAAIPKTDWLNELVIKGGSVSLRGYALKPEELAKALEPFAQSHEVQFQGESAYDARADRTRFAVSFRLPGATP